MPPPHKQRSNHGFEGSDVDLAHGTSKTGKALRVATLFGKSKRSVAVDRRLDAHDERKDPRGTVNEKNC